MVNSVPVVMIAEVTDELSRVDGSAVCCRRAEAATLLRLPPARLVGGTRRLAVPPLTKDAVAGRLRRLLSLADRAARETGVPDTASAHATDLHHDH